jgi:Transport protein Avl9
MPLGIQQVTDITMAKSRRSTLLNLSFPTDPTRPIQNTYLGSDDYLRARFEEYIMSLLSSVKYAQAFDPKNAFKSESTLDEIMRDEEKGMVHDTQASPEDQSLMPIFIL